LAKLGTDYAVSYMNVITVITITAAINIINTEIYMKLLERNAARTLYRKVRWLCLVIQCAWFVVYWDLCTADRNSNTQILPPPLGCGSGTLALVGGGWLQ